VATVELDVTNRCYVDVLQNSGVSKVYVQRDRQTLPPGKRRALAEVLKRMKRARTKP